MDDTAQNTNIPTAQSQPSEPVNTGTNKPSSNIEKFAPVSSSINKEVGSASEVARRSEEEIKLDSEIEQAGVRVSEPEVPQHEDVGIKPSLESAKPNLTPTKIEVLTKEEMSEAINKNKHILGIREQGESIYSIVSVYGLASLILKNFKKLHGKIINKTN